LEEKFIDIYNNKRYTKLRASLMDGKLGEPCKSCLLKNNQFVEEVEANEDFFLGRL